MILYIVPESAPRDFWTTEEDFDWLQENSTFIYEVDEGGDQCIHQIYHGGEHETREAAVLQAIERIHAARHSDAELDVIWLGKENMQ